MKPARSLPNRVFEISDVPEIQTASIGREQRKQQRRQEIFARLVRTDPVDVDDPVAAKEKGPILFENLAAQADFEPTGLPRARSHLEDRDDVPNVDAQACFLTDFALECFIERFADMRRPAR
jgi:hypothetical protein